MIGAVITGLLAGWLSGKIIRGEGYGFFADIILGVVGGVIGGAIFHLIGLHAYSLIGSLIVATAGAVSLVMLARLIRNEI